ncbi:MAG TPA: hypothetical protein VFB45_15485 [Pseudolabrys sp.]|nr:hypothetical protein [Pseudolabrys sp.]
MKLTDEQRADAQRALARMQLEMTSDDAAETRKQRLGIISKMLLAYPIANASAESGRARGETYLDALDDVPPWALQGAVRCWNRGAAGDEHDYRWPPAPAVLRKIAMAEIATLRPTVLHLENLIAAVPIDEAMREPSPEERAYILDGFAKLKADLTGQPQSEAAE